MKLIFLSFLIATFLLISISYAQEIPKCPDICEEDYLKSDCIFDSKTMECVCKSITKCEFGCENGKCNPIPEEPLITDADLMRKAIHERVKNLEKDVDFLTIKMDIFGTEYQTEDNGTVFLQLLNDERQPINNALCYLDIFYPNKTVFKSSEMMAYLLNSDGLYYHDFTVPKVNGIYMISAFCNFVHNITYMTSLQDSYVYSAYPDNNYGNETSFAVGSIFGTNSLLSYVKFNNFTDISSLNISNVYMHLYNAGGLGSNLIVNLQRVTNHWEETNVTWNNKPSADSYIWDSKTLPDIGWTTWNITDLFKGWINGTYTNYGMLLNYSTPSGTSWNYTGLYSKEYGGDYIPRLLIIYSTTEFITEIRGSGELHVSDIPEKTWDYFASMPEPTLISNHDYCLDNTTLIKEITYEICIDSKCKDYSKNETISCNYGCAENKCLPEPFWIYIIVIVIVIIIVIFAWLLTRGK